MRRRARDLLARLELDIDVNAPLGSCSLAVQQMVAIGRAIDIKATVLVLDEPSSSLDTGEVAKLFRVMRQLRGDGIAILFVTHFLDQVYAIADRITVLRNGRLVGEYPTAELPQLSLVEKMIGKELDVLERLDEQSRPDLAQLEGSPFLEAHELGRKGSVAPFDLTVRAGEVVGLAGLLGSGRTEVARLLFGADRADHGGVSVQGRTTVLRTAVAAIDHGISYQNAGQCSGLQAGGEGPRGRAARPERALTGPAGGALASGNERFGDEDAQGCVEADAHLAGEGADGGIDLGREPHRSGLF